MELLTSTLAHARGAHFYTNAQANDMDPGCWTPQHESH